MNYYNNSNRNNVNATNGSDQEKITFVKPYKKRKYNNSYNNSSNPSNTRFQLAKLNKEVTRLTRLTKPEYKFQTVYVDTSVCWAGGYVSGPVNVPALGPGNQDRIGNDIMMKNLTLRFVVSQYLNNEEPVRIVVIWDKQNQINSGSDLWEFAGNSGMQPVVSPKNYANKYRSKILYDQTFEITSDNSIHIRDVVIPLNKLTHFTGASTLETGAVKVCCIGVEPVATPQVGPPFQWCAFTTYTDM